MGHMQNPNSHVAWKFKSIRYKKLKQSCGMEAVIKMAVNKTQRRQNNPLTSKKTLFKSFTIQRSHIPSVFKAGRQSLTVFCTARSFGYLAKPITNVSKQERENTLTSNHMTHPCAHLRNYFKARFMSREICGNAKLLMQNTSNLFYSQTVSRDI